MSSHKKDCSSASNFFYFGVESDLEDTLLETEWDVDETIEDPDYLFLKDSEGNYLYGPYAAPKTMDDLAQAEMARRDAKLTRELWDEQTMLDPLSYDREKSIWDWKQNMGKMTRLAQKLKEPGREMDEKDLEFLFSPELDTDPESIDDTIEEFYDPVGNLISIVDGEPDEYDVSNPLDVLDENWGNWELIEELRQNDPKNIIQRDFKTDELFHDENEAYDNMYLQAKMDWDQTGFFNEDEMHDVRNMPEETDDEDDDL